MFKKIFLITSPLYKSKRKRPTVFLQESFVIIPLPSSDFVINLNSWTREHANQEKESFFSSASSIIILPTNSIVKTKTKEFIMNEKIFDYYYDDFAGRNITMKENKRGESLQQIFLGKFNCRDRVQKKMNGKRG